MSLPDSGRYLPVCPVAHSSSGNLSLCSCLTVLLFLSSLQLSGLSVNPFVRLRPSYIHLIICESICESPCPFIHTAVRTPVCSLACLPPCVPSPPGLQSHGPGPGGHSQHGAPGPGAGHGHHRACCDLLSPPLFLQPPGFCPRCGGCGLQGLLRHWTVSKRWVGAGGPSAAGPSWRLCDR